MNVGVIKLSIRLPLSRSLKAKRRIVQSLCQKIKNNFEVAVSEVESLDDLKMGVIGISLVSNSSVIIQKVISQILHYVQEQTGDFVLLDFHHEIIAGL